MTVYLVDPYYLFHKDRAFNEQKYGIGYSFDQGRRYKIFTYWNNPTDKIILGASEINIINERNIPEEGWHSLSYGGAPLQESLRMYWEVSKEHQLKKVIIAPEFIKYYNAIASANGDSYYANFDWETSQSANAIEIFDNKIDYFIDKYTLKSTWYYLADQLRTQSTRNKPTSTKDDFWKHQIKYAQDSYNGIVIREKKIAITTFFSEIKKDAESKGIDIIIVIPIQHVDLLREEFREGVYEVYEDYLMTLTRLFDGIFYLAYVDGVSNTYEAFSDPFHCISEKTYIDSLFCTNKMHKLMAEEVSDYLNGIRNKLYNND